MAKARADKQRPSLIVLRDEARQRIATQIEKARSILHVSVSENEEARRWYDFTSELLRQLFTTDELSDEFTGRGRLTLAGDSRVGSFLRKLVSIHERLELYPEPVLHIPTIPSTNSLTIIEKLIKKFHLVTRQLRQRYDNRPTLNVSDEYDAQDLLHALLKIYFDDVRAEEWTPSYAGGSSRMDFLLKTERTVIEIKKTRIKLGAKEVGEQLATDILRYRSHPDCQNLVCFVYDPEERILNPHGLEGDLSQAVGEMRVRVYVTQK